MLTYKNGTASSAAAPVVMYPPVSKGVPIVAGYRATGDAANARFAVFTGGLVTKAGVSNASQAVLACPVTTGFTANDYVIVMLANGTMYWHTVASVQAATSLTLNENLAAPTTATTRIFRMDKIAHLPCGNGTVNNAGGENGICFGNKQMPIAGAVISGTTANSITRFAVAYNLSKN